MRRAVPIIVLLVVGNMAVSRNPNARVARTRALMSVPVIGPIIQYSAVERFCRIIGAMMRAGVPLPETMAAAIESTNNAVFERELRVARDEMLEGEGVAGPLQRTELFPLAAIQMGLAQAEAQQGIVHALGQHLFQCFGTHLGSCIFMWASPDFIRATGW